MKCKKCGEKYVKKRQHTACPHKKRKPVQKTRTVTQTYWECPSCGGSMNLEQDWGSGYYYYRCYCGYTWSEFDE